MVTRVSREVTLTCYRECMNKDVKWLIVNGAIVGLLMYVMVDLLGELGPGLISGAVLSALVLGLKHTIDESINDKSKEVTWFYYLIFGALLYFLFVHEIVMNNRAEQACERGDSGACDYLEEIGY